jgi:hypothetical protein
MDFVNELELIFNFDIDNNTIEEFNTIKDGRRNVIISQLVQQLNGNVNEAQGISSINYLVYIIISTLTNNQHHCANNIIENYRPTYINEDVENLVRNGHMTYLTQGQIKQILVCANEITNDNYSYDDMFCDILDVLTDEQFFFILHINDQPAKPLIKHLFNGACNAYGLVDIYANDYYTLNYNFEIGNDEKEEEIRHLESVYDENDMSKYFHFTINKLFNSDCGITTLGAELGMSYEQLLWCIYYMTNTQLCLSERFHKFVNVLTLEQITYVGV